MSSIEIQRSIAENLFFLRFLRVDSEEPIFPKNPSISAMLRLAQFKVTATLDPTDEYLDGIADRVIGEARAISVKELSDMLLFMAIGTVLSERSRAILPKKWVPLLCEYQVLLEADNDFARSCRELDAYKHGLRGWTIPQFLFVMWASHLNSIGDLSDLFEQLDALDPRERDTYLSALREPDAGAWLMISSAWLADYDRGKVEGAIAAAQMEHLAEIAHGWGNRNLAVELRCAQAVMLDEYADNPHDALAILDRAESRYPNELGVAILERRTTYVE